MSVRIIVDSTADCPENVSSRLTVVPLTITFGKDEYVDRVTIDYKTFYEKLSASDVLPFTSQASPFIFEEKFREAVEAGDTVVAITASSKLSGTNRSAVVAAEEFHGKVFVVDSGTIAIGLGILAEYALSLADRGYDAETIAKLVSEKRSDVCVVAILDTLEYLKRGGRISPTVAFAGGILGIKPLVNIEDGVIGILGKARGQKQGATMLTNTITEMGNIDEDMPYLLGYTGIEDTLLRDYISASFDFWCTLNASPRQTPIGSVVGTHAGPGAYAVAFFRKNRV